MNVTTNGRVVGPLVDLGLWGQLPPRSRIACTACIACTGDGDMNRDAHQDDQIAPASWPSVTQQDPCQRQTQPPQAYGLGALALWAGIRSIRHCDGLAVPMMLYARLFRAVSWIIYIIHEKDLRFHQMNHDWFTLRRLRFRRLAMEKGAYAAALETK